MPKKHALIIGINKYPYRGEDEQLGGCVNDANLIRKVLISKLNFAPENVVMLCDEQASVAAIQAEMDRLANTIEQDDTVVFHFSGHGSQCQTKTEFTSEGSGLDNYIIPSDDSEPVGDGTVIWRDVRDHEFNAWLQRLAKKTRNTTLIFDACHSGTMTRGGPGSAKIRSTPPDDRPSRRGLDEAGSEPEAAGRSVGETKRGKGAWLALSDNYVVISGCRDSQTSGEDYFNCDGESVKHGLLTYNLTAALLKAKPGDTYRDLFERVCSGVVARVSDQNPQIEGAIDRELFGVKDIEPLRFIPVSEVNGKTLVLEGGAAHGLRSGSKWDIYPPGAKQQDPHERLGVVQISHVGALSSRGVMTESQGAIVAGARCVEIEAVDTIDALQVDLSGLQGDDKTALESGITQSRLLRLADSAETAQIYATIVDSPSSLPACASIDEQARVAGPAWAFLDNSGALCMPLHRVNEPGVSTILLQNLEKVARFRNVLALDNPETTLKVEFNLFKQGPDGELVSANGGNTEFTEDDPLVLELINHETERAVFFSILWISASREISQCYPPGKSCEELSPDKTIRIGHDENKLMFSWDDNYFGDVGSECCKVIFSSRESDFSWLNQQGVRAVGDQKSSVPAFDAAYRGAGPDPESGEKQNKDAGQLLNDWDAINRSFVIIRSPG